MRTFICVLLVCVAALTFIQGSAILPPDESSSEDDSFFSSEDFSESGFLTDEAYEKLSKLSKEEIEKLIEELEDALSEEGIKKLVEYVSQNKRIKRQSSGDNSHFCCNKNDPGQVGAPQLHWKVRLVTKVFEAGQTYPCGYRGWDICEVKYAQTIEVSEYYQELVYPMVPADAFKNGCPDDNIVCCNGYVMYKNLGNCLTFIQLEDVLRVVREYNDELYELNKFIAGN